ncbi:MAG: hypothetical protein HY791_25815 [Deltaproteobacteria bacterium]|nr:hypothetical protein [Deltaproteobacteria bacterium]
MEWIAVVAIFVVSAVIALVVRKNQQQKLLTAGGAADWKQAIEAAAQELGGRAAFAGATAQLRAEQEGLTITLKVEGDQLIAETTQYPDSKPIRIFLGASGAQPPSDFAHVPELELPPAYSLDPPVQLRSDEPTAAVDFANGAARELSEAAREAKAASASVLCRGGTVRLSLRGGRPSTAAVVSAIGTAARLSGLLGGDRAKAEVALKQIPSPSASKVTCALCGGDRRPEVPWVVCQRCRSPHHEECWTTAQRCARAGCGGTVSEPLT